MAQIVRFRLGYFSFHALMVFGLKSIRLYNKVS